MNDLPPNRRRDANPQGIPARVRPPLPPRRVTPLAEEVEHTCPVDFCVRPKHHEGFCSGFWPNC